MFKPRLARLFLVVAIALAMSATLASPSSAASKYVGNAGSETRCFDAFVHYCLYYLHIMNSGAYFPADANISNLAGYHFNNDGQGAGQYVKNNATAMYCDYELVLNTCNVYYNSGYAGNWDWMYSGDIGSLWYTWNEDASVKTT